MSPGSMQSVSGSTSVKFTVAPSDRAWVQLARDSYVGYLPCEALSREAHRFALNRVSPEQTAELWIEAGRPAPGGGLWTATKITRLLVS